MKKTGMRIATDYGEGIVTGIDCPESKNWRYQCKLDKDPFKFKDGYVYFWPAEVQILLDQPAEAQDETGV